MQSFVILPPVAALAACELAQGGLTPCHDSSPSNLHQGTVFTRASKVDRFLGTLFKYPTQCVRGERTPSGVGLSDAVVLGSLLMDPEADGLE